MIEYLEEYTFFKYHIQRENILKNLFILYLSKITTGSFIHRVFGITIFSIYRLRKKNLKAKGTFWGSIDLDVFPYIIRQQNSDMIQKVLELKKEYPTLGAIRILNLLKFKGVDPIPGLSTIKRILAEHNI